jgi:hypothetical protein
MSSGKKSEKKQNESLSQPEAFNSAVQAAIKKHLWPTPYAVIDFLRPRQGWKGRYAPSQIQLLEALKSHMYDNSN